MSSASNVSYLTALIAALAGVFLVVAVVGIASWIVMSIALFQIAKNRGFENAWIAWIPGIGLAWVVGKCVGSLRLFGLEIAKLELVLPIGCAVVLFAAIPFVGWLLSIAYAILIIYALYLFFMQYRPSSATMYTVLCAIPFTSWICLPLFLFMIRNDQYIG